MTKKGKLTKLIGKDKIEVFEQEIPEVKDDGILIEVKLAGICGTDIHIIENANLKEFRNHLPMTLGHEVTGKIISMGKKANESMFCDTRLKEGDKIVVYLFIPCGNCWWERKFGTDHNLICDHPPREYHLNTDKWPFFVGGWGEYLYIHPGSWLWKVPDDIPNEMSVLTEPFSVGIRAVQKAIALPALKNFEMLSFGGTVVVLGSGAIGVLTAIAAKIAGAGKVILIGGPEKNLQIAKEIGATDITIDISKLSPEERISKVKEMSEGGYGADVVFEVAGVPEAFIEGLEMTRKLGTFVELGCWMNDGRTVPINVAKHIVAKDITLYGVTNQPPQDFTKALRTMESVKDRFDFTRLITNKFPLEKVQEAINICKDSHKKGIKTVLLGKE